MQIDDVIPNESIDDVIPNESIDDVIPNESEESGFFPTVEMTNVVHFIAE